MKKLINLVPVLLLTFSISKTLAKDNDKNVTAPIYKMLVYAKKNKDDKALKYIGISSMANFLLGKYQKKATAKQKKIFENLLKDNIKYQGLPKVAEYFPSVDVPLVKPVYKNAKAFVESSVIYAGSERLKFQWVLAKVKNKYVIIDILNDGKSSLEKNKTRIHKQIEAKGMDGFLAIYKEKVEGMKK